MDGSDTGTGKTHAGAEVALRLGMDVVIYSPKQVVEPWFDVCEIHGTNVLGIANYETAKNGKYYTSVEDFQAEHRVLCPYMQVIKDEHGTHFEWDLPDNTLVILDEAHKGKNNITMTSKFITSLGPLLTDGKIKLLILSATITDSIDCFQAPAYLLGLSTYGKHAYRAWLRNLRLRSPGKTDVELIHSAVYPNYGSRMRIRDLLASENEIIRNLFKHNDILAKTYDMTPEVEKEITDAYEAIDAAIVALKTKQQGEECPLTIILRARQRIEMLKIPTFIMEAMEYLLNGHAVIIFVNFTNTIQTLFEALDPFVQDECGSFVTFIQGGQSAIDRKYNRVSFQNDRSRLIIANVKAGGVGLSLHDLHGNFSRVSLISPPWSSIELKQVLGRPYRAGARSNCIQRIIYCKGKVSTSGEDGSGNDTTFKSNNGNGKIGVEELIAEAQNKKLRTIEWINNGDDDELHLL
jgi:superfamily II DNA or RNA helicase